VNTQQSDRAIFEWLARTQQAPAQAWREWSDGGVALLPLGRRFAAARLPEELVYAAVGATKPQEVAALLVPFLDGPVIYDGQTMGGTYYALMERRNRPVWEHQDIAGRRHLPRRTQARPPQAARHVLGCAPALRGRPVPPTVRRRPDRARPRAAGQGADVTTKTAPLSPECSLREHTFCAGNREICRKGAASWERPIMTLRCGCSCHTRRRR
jgi:hypothetical protein